MDKPIKKTFTLTELAPAELETFKNELIALCEKHSVYLEPVPKMMREKVEQPWLVGGDLLILKKTELIAKTDEPVDAA